MTKIRLHYQLREKFAMKVLAKQMEMCHSKVHITMHIKWKKLLPFHVDTLFFYFEAQSLKKELLNHHFWKEGTKVFPTSISALVHLFSDMISLALKSSAIEAYHIDPVFAKL